MSKFKQLVRTVLLSSIWLAGSWRSVDAQELNSPDPVQLVNSTQRLTIEQIQSLINSQQSKDALAQLQTLLDLTTPVLIESSPLQQAATQRVQPYQRLSAWSQNKLEAILTTQQQLRQEYEQQFNAIAEGALRSLQKSKNLRDAIAATKRYRSSSSGTSLALLVADLQLEAGHALAATETLHTHFQGLTGVNLKDLNPLANDAFVPWPHAYAHCKSNVALEDILAKQWQLATAAGGDKIVVDVYWRLLVAAAMQPQWLDFDGLHDWIAMFAPTIADVSLRQRLTKLLDESNQWPEVVALSSAKSLSTKSFSLDSRPTWQSQLERWVSGNDLTPATRPVVGQTQAALPYFPRLYDGKVFVHELGRIRAYQADSGRAWPSGSADAALFDTQINSAALIPLGYPLIGSPKAGLSIDEGCLYARIGSPVTAWVSRSKTNDGSSFSSLIGLDLDRQGSLLPGFPLRLAPPLFQDAEFEGVPVVHGQHLIVAVTERDNVGIRRSLAAFDRYSGAFVWRTPVLGSGVVVGSERANMMSAAQPFAAGGLIYFNTDLGSVACVDATNGETLWLSRYQRVHRAQTDYPRPNRFRYRDGNAAIVHRGLVYCMPQDCPELLALDAFTGQLVWSTDESEVADCTYIAGTCDGSLIVGGDRVVWLDRNTGRVATQFPAIGTPGTIHALPQPRALGRVNVVGERVFMATTDRVYVFAADQTNHPAEQHKQPDSLPAEQREVPGTAPSTIAAQPKILDQLSTRYCGSEGGIWAFDQQTLIIATPGRLICFRAER